MDEHEAPEPAGTSRVRVIGFAVAMAAVAGAAVFLESWRAGILIVVGLLVTVVAHEAGHYLVARRCGMNASEFFVGFGPRIVSWRSGGTEWGVKAILAGGYVRISGMSSTEELDEVEEESSYRAKAARARIAVALAGIGVNLTLAFVLATVGFWGLGVDPQPTTTVGYLDPTMPAAAAGLRVDDRIVAIDGTATSSFTDVRDALRASEGRTVAVRFERAGAERVIDVKPVQTEQGPKLGFASASRFRNVGPIEAAGAAARFEATAVAGTAEGLARLFSPAGIARYARHVAGATEGEAAEKADGERPMTVIGVVSEGDTLTGGSIWRIVLLVAVLNVFLAMFNLIPLLPFDGGHAVIAAFEGVRAKLTGRDKRVDQRRLLPISFAVFALLILLGVSAAFLDLKAIAS